MADELLEAAIGLESVQAEALTKYVDTCCSTVGLSRKISAQHCVHEEKLLLCLKHQGASNESEETSGRLTHRRLDGGSQCAEVIRSSEKMVGSTSIWARLQEFHYDFVDRLVFWGRIS